MIHFIKTNDIKDIKILHPTMVEPQIENGNISVHTQLIGTKSTEGEYMITNEDFFITIDKKIYTSGLLLFSLQNKSVNIPIPKLFDDSDINSIIDSELKNDFVNVFNILKTLP